ncbi:MAG: hypothetical protein ABW321_03985 [Polyangiales bacterium]
MRRIKPQTVPQEPSTAHATAWQDIALLVAYLVIAALSVLTVLMPTTDNKVEQIETKAQQSTAGETRDTQGASAPK